MCSVVGEECLAQHETHPVLPPECIPEAVNLIDLLTLVQEVVGAGLHAVLVLSGDREAEEHRELRERDRHTVRYLDHLETDVSVGYDPALQVSLGVVATEGDVFGHNERVPAGCVEDDRRLHSA